jgi:hypothetical protein
MPGLQLTAQARPPLTSGYETPGKVSAGQAAEVACDCRASSMKILSLTC